MSEISYYSASAFENNVAVARREDVESVIADLRAALAKAEAERDASHALLTTYNLGGWTDAEAVMRRALAAESERDALKARAERLAAYVKAIHAREDAVEPNEYEDPHGEKWRWYSDLWNVREAARAAVDAHRDLEGPK